MEDDRAEAVHDEEEQTGLVELGDGVGEVELLEHVLDVLREALHVRAEVGRQVGRVGQQPVEVVERGVVEGVSRRLPELGRDVLQPLPLSFALTLRTSGFVRWSTQSSRRRTVNGRMTSWY